MNEQEPHPGLGSVLKKEVPLSEAITNVKLPKERTNENGSLMSFSAAHRMERIRC